MTAQAMPVLIVNRAGRRDRLQPLGGQLDRLGSGNPVLFALTGQARLVS